MTAIVAGTATAGSVCTPISWAYVPPMQAESLKLRDRDTSLDPSKVVGAGGSKRRVYDALAVLLIWAATWFVAVFIEPNYDEFSTAELTYSTLYNAAVGYFIGFRLFDRLTRETALRLTTIALAAIGSGTLFNEAVVEPLVFGDSPMNGEGVYHGILDALIVTSMFLLLRLVGRLTALQHASADKDSSRNRPDPNEAAFFVKVAGETRRIMVEDVLYLSAERDFTRIICEDEEHFASGSLKSILQKTDAFDIVRVHKSFAVNLKRVEAITRTEARIGDRRVAIGRKYWDTFTARWHAQPPSSLPAVNAGVDSDAGGSVGFSASA